MPLWYWRREQGQTHFVAQPVHARSGGEVHCDDFVADGDTNRTSYIHSWNDRTRYSSTGRRKGKTGDLVITSWLDQGHSEVQRRLQHRQEFSFGDPDSAVKTRSQNLRGDVLSSHPNLGVYRRSEQLRAVDRLLNQGVSPCWAQRPLAICLQSSHIQPPRYS
jgi:hypothetical protein